MFSNLNLDQLDTLLRGPVFVPAQLKARERVLESLREEGLYYELNNLATSRKTNAYYRDHFLKNQVDEEDSRLSFSVRWLFAPSGALMVWLVLLAHPTFFAPSVNIAQELLLSSPGLPDWQEAEDPMKALQEHHATRLRGEDWLDALPQAVAAALVELVH